MSSQLITALGNRGTRRYWIVSGRRHDRCNRSLVNRVEDLMDPSFVMSWRTSLRRTMGKKTSLQDPQYIYNIPCETESIVLRPLPIPWKNPYDILQDHGIRTVCYTNIFRDREYLAISSLFRCKTGGLCHWFNKVQDHHKGWLSGPKNGTGRGEEWSKLHAVISIHNITVLSFSVTDEHVHECKGEEEVPWECQGQGQENIRRQGPRFKGDIQRFSTNTAIPSRRNASTQSGGLLARDKVVRLIGRTLEKECKESVQYGRRWNVETYFSDLKRRIGDVIKANRPSYIAQESILNVQYYDIMRIMINAHWIALHT